MFDAEEIATDLGEKLASRLRHVCVFVGAGAGKAAGLPDLAGLQERVLESLETEERTLAEGLFEGRNVQGALSRLRRIATLLDEDGGEFGGFDAATARDLDYRICSAIIAAVDHSAADLSSFRRLAIWAGGSSYATPIEIFSASWDLLIETGFESVGAPYFDGFVGALRAPFRPELVERVGDRSLDLPSNFTRLWKLHGSTNWVFEEVSGIREVVRLGHPAGAGETAAIYPSEEKYEDSRRVPFIVLFDRLRHALNEPETIMLTSGYSFRDQHLNEIVFDAAVRRPRSEVVALIHGQIPEVLAERARELPNLTVLGSGEAILGSERRAWRAGNQVPNVWDDGRFLLGDFNDLTKFLAGTPAVADASV